MFPRIYINEPCPLEGYEAYTLRILANPTGAEKEARDKAILEFDGKDFTALAASFVPILGETKTAGLDFSSVEAGVKTLTQDDLPDEVVEWILLAPATLWAARSEELKKKLQRS